MSISLEAGGAIAPVRSAWTEHRNAQGRVYWYHQTEKRSVWEKPIELKSARERAIDSTPWKEYQSGERKYYVHSVTKESSWTLPQELKDLFDNIPDEASPAPGTPSGTQSPGPNSVMSPGVAVQPRPMYNGPPPGFPAQLANGITSNMPNIPSSSMQPEFAATNQRGTAPLTAPIAGGEEAFFQLLQEKNVDQSWSWEQTMRKIITEPLYKSLATLAERKAAFSKYISNLKEEEETSRKERAKEVEPKIRKQMQPLIDAGQIQSWLSYEGMLCRCKDQTAWKALEKIGLAEARDLWATIRREIREVQATSTREIRHRNMDLLMSLLRNFEASVLTRWKDARQTITECDEWKSDAHLSSMELSDMIIVFDEFMKSIEKEKGEELKGMTHKRKRQDRLCRDWFIAELQRGKEEGWINAKTDFGDVYDRYCRNEKFIRMLGQPGSTALDLFFDVMDEIESKFRIKMHAVEALFAQNGFFEVKEETTVADLDVAIQAALKAGGKGGEIIADLRQEEKALILEDMQRVKQEETRRIDRKLRHLSEDLRYALKKLAYHKPDEFDNEEQFTKSWESIKEQIQELRLPEWKAFEEVTLPIDVIRLEEAKKGAWERFVKRQREKAEERKVKEKERQNAAQPEEHEISRKRRGEDGEEEGRRRSSRRAGKVEEEEMSNRTRSSRRERRAGEMDEVKEKDRDRKERRRSNAAEETEANKRPRLEEAKVEANAKEEGEEEEIVDSEKEEGEV